MIALSARGSSAHEYIEIQFLAELIKMNVHIGIIIIAKRPGQRELPTSCSSLFIDSRSEICLTPNSP